MNLCSHRVQNTSLRKYEINLFYITSTTDQRFSLIKYTAAKLHYISTYNLFTTANEFDKYILTKNSAIIIIIILQCFLVFGGRQNERLSHKNIAIQFLKFIYGDQSNLVWKNELFKQKKPRPCVYVIQNHDL